MKFCPSCKQTKPLDHFGKLSSSKDGLYYYCKECQRERRNASYAKHGDKAYTYNKTWVAANPEKHKEYQRRWKQKNRERLRDYNDRWKADNSERYRALRKTANKRRSERLKQTPGTLAYAWEKMLDYFKHRCLACGTTNDITQDHVIPLALGGVHHISNMQPLCMTCNQSKNATIRDYRDPAQLQAFLVSLA